MASTTMVAPVLRRFLIPSVRMPFWVESKISAVAPQLRRQFSSTPTPFATLNQVRKARLPLAYPAYLLYSGSYSNVLHRDADLSSVHGNPSVLRSEMSWRPNSRGCV